jgi:hypothetical protein
MLTYITFKASLFMHFAYERRRYIAVLIKRCDTVRWRHKCLRQIKNFGRKKINIILTDESWDHNSIRKYKFKRPDKLSRQDFLTG